MTDTKIPVIYITGHGRSGSTMLDMLLGSQKGFVSIGQINRLSEMIDEFHEIKCSCKNTAFDCELWGRVYQDLQDSTYNYSIKNVDPYFSTGKRYQQLSPVIKNVLDKNSLPVSQELKQKQVYFLQSVLKNSNAQYISDSSKNVIRLLALLKNEMIDVNVIYLVRKCEGVVESKLKRKSETKANPWLASLSWAYQNLLSLIVYKTVPSTKKIYIEFEELISSPQQQLQNIKQTFNLPDNFDPSKSSTLDTTSLHIFAGNKVSKGGKQAISKQKNHKLNLLTSIPIYMIGKPFEVILRLLSN